jgi:hypothetical protein
MLYCIQNIYVRVSTELIFQEFVGINYRSNSYYKTAWFPKAIEGKYLRIYPRWVHYYGCLKLEVHGCWKYGKLPCFAVSQNDIILCRSLLSNIRCVKKETENKMLTLTAKVMAMLISNHKNPLKSWWSPSMYKKNSESLDWVVGNVHRQNCPLIILYRKWPYMYIGYISDRCKSDV